MESKEWYSWQGPARRPYQHDPSQPGQMRPRVQEDTLKELFIQVERKTFAVALKENVRGRFLRVTEENANKFTTIIIPEAGLEDFLTVMIEMVKTSKNLPPPEAKPDSGQP